MDVTYTGPFAGVVIPTLDDTIVFAGNTITVPDDLGASLVARGDFTPVPPAPPVVPSNPPPPPPQVIPTAPDSPPPVTPDPAPAQAPSAGSGVTA